VGRQIRSPAGTHLIEFNYICRSGAGGGIEAVRSGQRRIAQRAAEFMVGDWVVVRKRPDEDRGAIVAVLPRRSWFSRRSRPVTDEQVVAANVDVVFIVAASTTLQSAPARDVAAGS
jgi:putative ribosome biogenesis GTPase RsgA